MTPTKGDEDKSKNLVPPKKSDPSASPKNERSEKMEGGMSKGGLFTRTVETTDPVF